MNNERRSQRWASTEGMLAARVPGEPPAEAVDVEMVPAHRVSPAYSQPTFYEPRIGHRITESTTFAPRIGHERQEIGLPQAVTDYKNEVNVSVRSKIGTEGQPKLLARDPVKTETQSVVSSWGPSVTEVRQERSDWGPFASGRSGWDPGWQPQISGRSGWSPGWQPTSAGRSGWDPGWSPRITQAIGVEMRYRPEQTSVSAINDWGGGVRQTVVESPRSLVSMAGRMPESTLPAVSMGSAVDAVARATQPTTYPRVNRRLSNVERYDPTVEINGPTTYKPFLHE